MLGLCRLLERQGIFKGDLSTLQQLALQAVIISEDKRLIELEKSRFKSALVAAHPQHAEAILQDEIDDANDDVAEGYDYETFDEEADHTLTVDDHLAMEQMLQMLQGDGFAYEEHED